MKVTSINLRSYQNNVPKKFTKVSFGELDDSDYRYSPSVISKNEYYAKEMLINEKYNKMSPYALRTGDDTGISANELWKRLNNIENMRSSELAELKIRYSKY